MTKDNIFNNNNCIQSAAGKLQQLATNHILRAQELSGAIKTLVASDISSVLVSLKTGATVDLADYNRAHYYRDYTVSDFELFENMEVVRRKDTNPLQYEYTISEWNRQGVCLKGVDQTIWVSYAELRNAFEAVCTNATDYVLGVRLPDRVEELSAADHKTVCDNSDIRVEWEASEAPTAARELMEEAAERATRKTPAVMP
jgi:hypothetical protein